MKKQTLLLLTFFMLFASTGKGQVLSESEAQKLAKDLNAFISDNIALGFEKDKGILSIDDKKTILDLRADRSIAQDSMSKKEMEEKLYSSGRYIGSIFWQYAFQPKLSSKVSFKATSSGTLFFTFDFPENDTIAITSSLNAFTSHHRISDSNLHEVEWSGDKYISILLQPEKTNDTIQFVVGGTTLSGKFERKDQQVINKNYTKTLRSILNREFAALFDQVLFILDTSKDVISVESKTEY